MLGESCTNLLCNNKVANSLMLEKQKDCGTHVVANTNQAHAIIENRQSKTIRKPRTCTMTFTSTILRSWRRMSIIGTKEFFVESWHSTKDKNTVNERNPFPSVYCLMKSQGEQ